MERREFIFVEDRDRAIGRDPDVEGQIGLAHVDGDVARQAQGVAFLEDLAVQVAAQAMQERAQRLLRDGALLFGPEKAEQGVARDRRVALSAQVKQDRPGLASFQRHDVARANQVGCAEKLQRAAWRCGVVVQAQRRSVLFLVLLFFGLDVGAATRHEAGLGQHELRPAAAEPHARPEMAFGQRAHDLFLAELASLERQAMRVEGHDELICHGHCSVDEVVVADVPLRDGEPV